MRHVTRNPLCFQGLLIIYAKDSPSAQTRKPVPGLGNRVFSQTLVSHHLCTGYAYALI